MLPVFKGFTVDIRLRQFRKMEYGKLPEFIPFDSPRGEDLIADIFRERFGEVKDPIQAMRITHLLQRIGFF